MIRITAIAFLAALPAIGLSLLQNRQVTGNWLTLPYMLSQYQYGIPTSFTFQPVPAPHRALTQEQRVDYDLQSAVHGATPDSPSAFFRRLGARVRFYRWFFPVPLSLVLPAFLPALRQPRFLWLAAALAIIVVGTNFYPYFYPHYIAGATCLFVLLMVTALEYASHWSLEIVRLLVVLCGAQFVFWYTLQLLSAWPRAGADQPIRSLGLRESSRRSGRPYSDRSPIGCDAGQATGLRAIQSGTSAAAVGVECRRYRQFAHRAGTRPGRGREPKAGRLLSWPHGLAARTGFHAAASDALSPGDAAIPRRQIAIRRSTWHAFRTTVSFVTLILCCTRAVICLQPGAAEHHEAGDHLASSINVACVPSASSSPAGRNCEYFPSSHSMRTTGS